MNILILGAGLIGTTTAWYLAQAGHTVTVIDRQPAAALETSFANGGQISVCHAAPWAGPKAPRTLLASIGRTDAPLLLHLRFDRALFSWGMRFLRECTPERVEENIHEIVRLALYSRQKLQNLRTELGKDFQYDHRTQGILHLYTDETEFELAHGQTAWMQAAGLDRKMVTPAEMIALEPALQYATEPFLGGTYTPSDESGDAHAFTQALAARAQAAGVQFLYDHSILKLETKGQKVVGAWVQTDASSAPFLIEAEATVLALGSYSSLLVKPLGLSLPVYPAKGYSATLELENDAEFAPEVSLTDDEYKLVFSRLGNRLRIAGTAEFNGYNLDLNPVRCQALIERTQTLFPRLSFKDPTFWSGLRPSTPNNVPIIGASPLKGLYYNTGHGTLGWTMACGSGALLADLLTNQKTEIPLPARRP